MIDYGLFEFATPPLTGGLWFTREVSKSIEINGIGSEYTIPWARGSRSDKHRVSMVRHPVDWLYAYFCVCRRHEQIEIPPFSRLGHECGFSPFVASYLERCPGAVGQFFATYESDTCLKLEDMPICVTELLSMFGVSSNHSYKALLSGYADLDEDLRITVMGAESQFVERYDYF